MNMVKLILDITALIAIGWVSGAEIGSWFGIQPVVEKFTYAEQLRLEQEILKTFGKVMPVMMPLSAVIVIALAIFSYNDDKLVLWLRIIAAVCIAITIVTTLTINVPINNLTAKWSVIDDFGKWSEMRTRWHFFQGIRGGLFLLSFVLLAISSALHRPS